jgi:hypothetical protein
MAAVYIWALLLVEACNMGFTGKKTMLNSGEWLMSNNILPLTLPATMFWKNIAYGAGKFVSAIFRGQSSVYSQDSRVWTNSQMPQQDYWNSIVYGNGLFVAVADSASAYSSDGITFTMTQSTTGGQSVAYGKGVFVSVKNSSIGGYSYDGINWTQVSLPLGVTNNGIPYNSIAYGGGMFVAGTTYTTNNQGVIAYSSNGINWTRVLIPAGQTWNAANIAYGNGMFIAVPIGVSSRKVFYSYDGINWAQNITSLPFIGTNTYGDWKVKYGAGLFSFINYKTSTYPNNQFLYGTGPAWFYSTLPRDQDSYALGYGKGRFVVFGKTRASYTSSNSLPGEVKIDTSIQKNVKVYTYGKGKHIIFPNTGLVSYSNSVTDPFTWNESTLNAQNFTDVVYGGGEFQAISSLANGFSVSTNGANWSSQTIEASSKKSITYGRGAFVCVNNSGVNYYTRNVSGSWVKKTNLPSNQNITSIRYGLGKFIISTTGSVFFSSTDYNTWASNAVPAGDWSFLEHGNGLFVAFKSASSSEFIYSTNGTSWVQGQFQESLTITSVKYGGGFFIATKNNGEIIYSDNGINWNNGVGNLGNNLRIRGYGAGRFFFSTDTGNVLFTLHPRIFRVTNVAAPNPPF